jgi:hypothetical protein
MASVKMKAYLSPTLVLLAMAAEMVRNKTLSTPLSGTRIKMSGRQTLKRGSGRKERGIQHVE